MIKENKTVVIIGGGITGLTTAYYLQKKAKENNINLNIKLIEASHRIGGKASTIYKDGFTIERGPDSFWERNPSAIELAKEVGLEANLVNNVDNKSFIVARGQSYEIPEQLFMGMPTQIKPFLTTRLFSLQGKLRAACDLFLPRTEQVEDQSLGAFFRRRLGDEVVENLIEPLLSGVYAGDIDSLSLNATFPEFRQLEQKYRSITLGLKKSFSLGYTNYNYANNGIFFNFTTGLQSFVNAIAEKLDRSTIIKSTRVNNVIKRNEKYVVYLNSDEQIIADSVVAAVPHYVTTRIFSYYKLFSTFKNMPTTSVASVSMAFSEDALKNDRDGASFFVSRNNDFAITACSLTHKMWPHSTPEGKVLLRCYVGRLGHETIVDLSDDQIVKIVLEDLNKMMDIKEEPEFSIVTRWKDSMPQYTVGHKDRLMKIKEEMTEQLPGVYLAGASYGGQSLPECIEQGKSVVEDVLSYLNTGK